MNEQPQPSPTVEDRLNRLERAVFAAKDDWPTGHASLQAQLDEVYYLIGNLKAERREPSAPDENDLEQAVENLQTSLQYLLQYLLVYLKPCSEHFHTAERYLELSFQNIKRSEGQSE